MPITTSCRATLVAVAASLVVAAPAAAHDRPATPASDVQAELAAMREQMAAMQARIGELERQLAEPQPQPQQQAGASAAAASPGASAPAKASPAHAEPPVAVAWKGAPTFSGEGGWTFKPRGRLELDVGSVDAPSAIVDQGLGFASEVRRARLGVEGDVPGGFGYRLEFDFADGGAEMIDGYLTYRKGGLTVTAGQHNPFQSLEELSSSRFGSFMERAAFTDAFGFERRLGLSAAYTHGIALAQAGVFTDNAADLGDDANNARSVDARLVAMPRMGKTQLHFGGSVHWRDLGDAVTTVRYRQRPFLHVTDVRLIDTGAMAAEHELGSGLEAAAIAGPLHVAGEAFWQRVDRGGALADPTFFGGYAEVGYFLTRGDTRGYKGGVFDRVRPARGLDKGGIGAIEVNLRYDYLDLVDAGITGGLQNAYAASLIWTPAAYTRLIANFARIEYDDAARAAAGSRDYTVDAFGMRAQFDF